MEPEGCSPTSRARSITRATFNPIYQYFLRRGYAVLAPNVRGSTGYGTAYMNLDNTTKRMDSVADLAHAGARGVRARRLRACGVRQAIPGYGRLLTLD